ncbi:uncharacterized protein DS421_7g207790 [Arachis hypogaea]|nr:uncharacterized protein DS421_7g207790 [Arachis hypogaea]
MLLIESRIWSSVRTKSSPSIRNNNIVIVWLHSDFFNFLLRILLETFSSSISFSLLLASFNSLFNLRIEIKKRFLVPVPTHKQTENKKKWESIRQNEENFQ